MLTTDRRPYSLLYYQLLWEASVTEVDEADGREGGHQLVCGLLHITFFQLGIVMDRQRQRRKINHRNRGHLEWTLIWFCTVTSNSWSLLHDHQKQLHRSIKHASKSLQTFFMTIDTLWSKTLAPFFIELTCQTIFVILGWLHWRKIATKWIIVNPPSTTSLSSQLVKRDEQVVWRTSSSS